MKKKKIAQYCCAALVLAGMGLNIQNALADYGMNAETLSLIASNDSGTLPCNSASYDLVESCDHSNVQSIVIKITRCGVYAGDWLLSGCILANGVIIYHDLVQKTHLKNELLTVPANTEYDPDGKMIQHFHNWLICKEKSGAGDSDCKNAGDKIDLGTD